jgi:hypothetical protein
MAYDTEEVVVNERERGYTWISNGIDHTILYPGVVAVRVSASGNHYLRLADGGLVIVKPTWDYIEIEPQTPTTGWTF